MSTSLWHDPNDANLVRTLFSPGSLTTMTMPDGNEVPVVLYEGAVELYTKLYSSHLNQMELANETLESTNAKGRALSQQYQEATKRITGLEEDKATLKDAFAMQAKLIKGLEEKLASSSKSEETGQDRTTDGGSGLNDFSIGTTSLAEVLKREKALQDHKPAIYRGQLSQVAVVDFLEACVDFVEVGAGGGMTKDDRCIDVAVRHSGLTVRSWLKEVWAKRFRGGQLPTNFNYNCKWEDFWNDYIEKWVTSSARTKTRTEFTNLRATGDPTTFNDECRKYIRLLTNGKSMSSIGRSDTLFEIYVQKLPSRAADNIMHSARVQNNLAGRNGIRYTLADAMMAYEDQAAMTTAKNTSINGPPGRMAINTAPQVDPDAMDLSAIQQSEAGICFRCRGIGHLARDCATPEVSRGPERRRYDTNRNYRGQQQSGKYKVERRQHGDRDGRNQTTHGRDKKNWRSKAVNVLEDDWSSAESSKLGHDEEEDEEREFSGNEN